MSHKLNKTEIRVKHLKNLEDILDVSSVEIKYVFAQLKGIEMRGHKLAEKYCNGEIDSAQWDNEIDLIKGRMRKLLSPNVLKNIHLNGDPRGYFLKIDNDYMRIIRGQCQLETDWGGYGIICPEGI